MRGGAWLAPVYPVRAGPQEREPRRFGSGANQIGVAPGALKWQAPGMGRDQLIDRLRPPATGRVDLDRRWRFEQRLRDFPQPLDAVRRAEQRVIAAHGVEDEPLIGLENVAAHASFVHCELQALLVEPHPRAGLLAVERQ